jgi:hypothetical protein
MMFMSSIGDSRKFTLAAWCRLLWCAVALLGVARLGAQELSFLAGGAGTPNLRTSSFSWDLDYKQHLYKNLSASVTWINEGHITGHHRDGTAGQIWLDVPLDDGRYSLSAGVGGYYYFDTVPDGVGGSLDLHGSAPIYSLSATAYVTHRWFARFQINRINPHNDFHSNTALLGVGYWFGQEKHPTAGKLGATPEEAKFVSGNEVTVYAGRSVVNAFYSEHGLAYAADYRRGLSRHLDGTISYIYEGDPKITRRSGLGLQLWPTNTFFDGRVTIGMGFGVYVYVDNKHLGTTRQLPVGGTFNTPAFAPLISPTFSYAFSDSWLARFTWHRVVTNYDRDSDVFLVGMGYRWGR